MTLPPEVLQQRYAAIELAYSEQNWPEAEGLSQALLAELPEVNGDPLRQRLRLLLGHTRLYGMADTAAARQHYSAVLAQSEEPTLREIAEQGLEQCLALEQPPTAAEAAAPAAAEAAQPAAAAAEPGGPKAEAAMPWLQQLGDDAGANSTPAVGGGGNAVPWLTQPGPGEAAPAESTAVAEAAAAETEPAVTELKVDTPAPETLIETRLSLEKASAEPLAEPLAVEIVEEPEQIAVAQADPQRREELEIQEPLVIGAAAIGGTEGATAAAAALEAAQRDALAQEFGRNLLRLRLG